MELTNKKVLIIGLAMSGIGAANLCLKHGATVTISDGKQEEQLKEQLSHLVSGYEVGKIFGRAPKTEEVLAQDIVVLSPAVPADLPFLEEARKQGVKVWGEIELAQRYAKAPIVGITGTNGKTTTTTLVGEILKAWKEGSMAAGNIGVAFTGVAETIPEDAMVALELSSFQLETIESLKPVVSAILNFTPDHLNRHHTYENYVAAKCRIFEFQTKEDSCVLNYDDPQVREKGLELEKKENGPRVCWFSHTEKTSEGVWCENGTMFAEIDGELVEVVKIDEMKIFGAHNEENAMAAVLCCIRAGVPMEIIREELKKFRGVAHRIEDVGTVNGVTYYNDSKGTNPDAAIKGLLAMKTKQTVLIGGGYDKGTPYEDWCNLFPGRVRELVLIGQTAGDIEECAIRCGFNKDLIYRAETFKEAIEECYGAALPGDSVLLSPACASWGMFDNYEQRGDIFRETVQEMMKKSEL